MLYNGVCMVYNSDCFIVFNDVTEIKDNVWLNHLIDL